MIALVFGNFNAAKDSSSTTHLAPDAASVRIRGYAFERFSLQAIGQRASLATTVKQVQLGELSVNF